jgi:hypothetical protein
MFQETDAHLRNAISSRRRGHRMALGLASIAVHVFGSTVEETAVENLFTPIFGTGGCTDRGYSHPLKAGESR